MPKGWAISQGLDFMSIVDVTATTTPQSYVFVPKDGPPAPAGTTKQPCVISDEIMMVNASSTTDAWVRWALPVNESVASGMEYYGGASAAQLEGSGNPFSVNQLPVLVDPSTFPAAVAAGPGCMRAWHNMPNVFYHIRAVGFSVVTASGTAGLKIAVQGTIYTLR